MKRFSILSALICDVSVAVPFRFMFYLFSGLVFEETSASSTATVVVSCSRVCNVLVRHGRGGRARDFGSDTLCQKDEFWREEDEG